MFEDLDLPKKRKGFEVGQSLDGLSVTELEEAARTLEAEIARIKADIERKKASEAAAAAIFKS